jgi:hypothetical protein
MVDTFLSMQINEAEILKPWQDFILDAQNRVREIEDKIYK